MGVRGRDHGPHTDDTAGEEEGQYGLYGTLDFNGDSATVDVKGECTLKDYEDHIEVMSYSHGVSLPVQPGTSNTGRTTGRPNFGELSITKQLDSTTPALNYYCAQAKNLGTIKLKLVRQDATNTGRAGVVYDL